MNIVVSSHAGYHDTEVLIVPANCTIRFYCDWGEELPNVVAVELWKDLMDRHQIPDATEIFAAGAHIRDYYIWYGAEFRRQCGVFSMEQFGVMPAAAGYSEYLDLQRNNNILLSGLLAMFAQDHATAYTLHWLACRTPA